MGRPEEALASYRNADGCAKQLTATDEELGPKLTVHRMGTRLTVFPRAAWASLRRGLARDADVVLEVVNGITFLTPLWLRRPRVALVHHVHRDHYVSEMGRPGAVAALLAETLPLRLLYHDTTFLTISHAAAGSLAELGVDPQDVSVVYSGVEADAFHAGLAGPIESACVELAILVGEEMAPLAKVLGAKVKMTHVPDASSALAPLEEAIGPGDAILVKGSNSIGLAALVEALASGSSVSAGTGKN